MALQFLSDATQVTLVDISCICWRPLRHNFQPIMGNVRRSISSIRLEAIHLPQQYDLVLCMGTPSPCNVPGAHTIRKEVAQLIKPGGYGILQLTDSAQLLGSSYAIWNLRHRTCSKLIIVAE